MLNFKSKKTIALLNPSYTIESVTSQRGPKALTKDGRNSLCRQVWNAWSRAKCWQVLRSKFKPRAAGSRTSTRMANANRCQALWPNCLSSSSWTRWGCRSIETAVSLNPQGSKRRVSWTHGSPWFVSTWRSETKCSGSMFIKTMTIESAYRGSWASTACYRRQSSTCLRK
jgi:hypothetical protein